MKVSAKMIGEQLGLTSGEVNKLLQKSGYLTGNQGNWIPTNIAQGLFELMKKTNGYGGYAKREWTFLMWDEGIVDELRKSLKKN